MKTIVIKGEEFKYQLGFEVSEVSECEWTEFYKETKTVYKRRYIFFGEKIPYQEPIILFKVWFWIEDPSYTKEEVRKRIEKQFELSTRKEEILKGEII